jgi:hypothetical protein
MQWLVFETNALDLKTNTPDFKNWSCVLKSISFVAKSRRGVA